MRKITDPHEAAQAFQRGEEAGFEYFFGELYSVLCYYAFRIVKDRAIAEDAAGFAFEQIWERKEGFCHPKVIKSWLYTTTRNKCLNFLLKEKRLELRQDEYAYQREGDFETGCIKHIIAAEVVKEVHDMVSVLPSSCRLIFELLYIHGLKVREIANNLKLSISTIKNQKARGLKILKQKFPNYNPNLYDYHTAPSYEGPKEGLEQD